MQIRTQGLQQLHVGRGVRGAEIPEVPGLDDERVAFPASSGVAPPLPHLAGQRRLPVQRNEPHVVHHLVENRDVSRRLEQLHEVVVRAGDHRRSGIEAEDAPLVHVAVLGSGVPAARRLASRHPRPARGQVGGQAPIRRIDDERRAAGSDDRRAVVEPEPVVAAGVAGGRRTVHPRGGPCFERRHVLVGQELPARQVGGSLQRRQGAEVPHALQGGRAVRRARHGHLGGR